MPTPPAALPPDRSSAPQPDATPAVHPADPVVQERLHEAPQPPESVVVEADSRLVRNVVLVGSESKNGYRYRSEALAAAASLYEDKPVFLDHAADPTQPRRRSARDLVGTLRRVRFEADAGGRLRGDVHVLDTESGRTFLALCEADGTGVGMSHVVLARRSADRRHVETIEQVVSVDAVAFPATTTSFREQSEADAAAAVGGEHETDGFHADGDSAAHDTLERERLTRLVDTLQEQLTVERRTARRDRMLAESGLTADAITPLFRRCVRNAESDNAAEALIEDRAWTLRSSRPAASTGPMPLSEARIATPTGQDAAAFVRAIRRG